MSCKLPLKSVDQICVVASEMENLSAILLTHDQYFLLYLIMGAYFGPHLKQNGSHKSALQRYAEGLSQYNADNLAGSRIRTMVMESVYYYMLRKAQQSVVVPRPWLHHFIHGNLPILVNGSATYPQFDDLFPSKLHKHSQFGNHHDVVENIVFINNPEPYFLKPVDIERFKRLTGLEDFLIDIDWAMLHTSNAKKQEIMNRNGISQLVDLQYVNYVPCTGLHHDGNEPSNYPMPFSNSPCNASPISSSSTVISSVNTISGEDPKSGMIFIPSFPSSDQWSNLVDTFKTGFALTGSAGRGQIGPVLGLMDIGESVDSYFFRVSLPGVLRDERDFSCEVELDGRVLIKGVTVTGERTIQKYSQTFEMQSQNLCPPGQFSISFKLPGPVDPKQFHGTFATDGILEGIALKAMRNRS